MPKRDIMREERLEETICESLKASGWIYDCLLYTSDAADDSTEV